MPTNTLNIDALNFESLARDILSEGNSLRFRARGGSMRPLIQDGDMLEVVPVNTANFRLGDILLFSDPSGQLMAHRLVHKVQQEGRMTLVMQGDANPRQDHPVPVKRVMGRITSATRDGGSFSFSGRLHSLIGWFFILVAPAIKKFIYRMRMWFRSEDTSEHSATHTNNNQTEYDQ